MSSLFKGLKRQLDGLQNPQTLQDLHNVAGRATHELVLRGLQREASPDGSPWAPTRPVSYTHLTLPTTPYV